MGIVVLVRLDADIPQKHIVYSGAQYTPFAMNHRMISFTLYTMGFMGFVLSLKRGWEEGSVVLRGLLQLV